MAIGGQHAAEMTIRSRFEDVPVLLAWMEERLAFTAAELRERVVMAAVEAVHNVIRHGGRADLATIRARLVFGETDARLDLEDDAAPLPLSALLAAELPDPDPDDPSTWPEGGIGLAMIRATADAIGYRREGECNRLTLDFMPRTDGLSP